MTDTLKILGQSNPSATTLTTMYTVPGATTASCSTITVCNQAGSAGTFRVSVAVGGAANNAKQYLFYDTPISANGSISATIGMSLGTADEVRVYASSANMSFNLFGVEVT